MNADDRHALAPAFVQLIKSPLRWSKNVDEDIPIIDEHPAGVSGTFTVKWTFAFLFQGLFNFITDGGDLSFAIGGADDKIIGESATLAYVQQNNI